MERLDDRTPENSERSREPPRVGVIGAGMSGLTCARALAARDVRVTVVDKARGPGGRISARRTEHGAIDHGAQYFTVRQPEFERRVEAWAAEGVVAEWRGKLAALSSDGLVMIEPDNRRYVGVPRMSALTRHLSEGLHLIVNWHVSSAERRASQWWLRERGGDELGPFDVVVVAVPAPQAAPLLAAAPKLMGRAREVEMAGCYAVMLAFEETLELPFDGAFVNLGPLAWIARNSSKPGRSGAETWVLHASPSWSQEHIEESPDQVIPQLLGELSELTQLAVPEPLLATAHRWRYALPLSTLAEPCLFDPELGLGACGDWCGGPRVEGAYLSGAALADRILAALAKRVGG